MRNRFLALLLTCALGAHGQRFIYTQSGDKTAQDAVTASKDVASGAVFDKMLHNVDLQGRQEIDVALAWVEQQMRAKIENFTYWRDSRDRKSTVLPGGLGVLKGACFSVGCELEALQFKIEFDLKEPQLTPDQVAARLRELDTKKAELEKALQQLQASAKAQDPAVVRAFALVNDNGQDLIDYAKNIAKIADPNGNSTKGVSDALTQIGAALDQMRGLYDAIKGIWDGYQAIQVDPVSLRPPQEQVDLQLLALEQDHLKTITRIRAREIVELGVALGHVTTALNRLNTAGVLNTTHVRVEDSLRAAVHDPAHERVRLTALLDGLHEAAAAVAEEDAAGRLADLRLSDEERRFSIRRSAVNSSTYDQTLQAACQRLGLYWKSGIKPTELAQLIFYLTNTGAIPAIAAK
jgi:hypothetical protein